MDEPGGPKKKANGRKAPRPKTSPRLRDIPTSSTYFWKPQLSEYIAQRVLDRTHDGTNDRWILANEIDALALNEIAVTQRVGFFQFLPNRNSWSRQTSIPISRGPAPDSLGASIPSLVYMRYSWSEQGQAKYFQSPHRSRYLASDFQLNPPQAQTPLYCIQVASDAKYALFTPEHDGFIMLRASPLYFGSTKDIGTILGAPKRKRKGADAELRIGQARGVWDDTDVDQRLQSFEHNSLQSLYDAIVTACHPSASPSSLTADHLLRLLPRPHAPEMGLDLGSDPVQPRTRLGGRLRRERPLQIAESEETTEDV